MFSGRIVACGRRRFRGGSTVEGIISPGGGRGMTASEVWGMRPQNGDSQHGVPSLNIGSATKCNGRLLNASDHVVI